MTDVQTPPLVDPGPPVAEQAPARPDGVLPTLVPTVLLSLSIGAEMFSGNWDYLGVPLGLDRLLLAAGLAMLVLYGVRAVSERKLHFRGIHVVLLILATYGVMSALSVNTLFQQRGGFALLDRFGLVPFLMFCLAPLVFGSARQRNVLLVVLVGVGLYLGITAMGEGLGINSLVYPKYILDPNVGLQFGRARGPFAESVANGLTMYMCAVASAIGIFLWKSKVARFICGIVILLCAAGVVFTLTRAVWLGAGFGTLAGMLAVKRARPWVIPALVVGALAVLAMLQFVPGLQTKASSRVEDKIAIWDRYNTNHAAVRMVEARPLFGFGWQTFQNKGAIYQRQAGTYPLTSADNEVHNVFLSHAAELGLVGALIWLCAFVGAVGGAIIRRGPPELVPWRVGLLAITTAFLIIANFGPLSYPMPNLLLWTWAGIVAADHYLLPASGARRRDDAIDAGSNGAGSEIGPLNGAAPSTGALA
jgi:putative inorganic carbon (hco3(-)) transporter